jgi:hypothetical protein
LVIKMAIKVSRVNRWFMKRRLLHYLLRVMPSTIEAQRRTTVMERVWYEKHKDNVDEYKRCYLKLKHTI